MHRWTGKMIVQVQFKNTHVNHLDPEQWVTATTHSWQDATPNDLMKLVSMHGTACDKLAPTDVLVKT